MSETWIKPQGFHFFDMADSSAIFVVCPSKTFVIQTECGIGERLRLAQTGTRAKRPQTHELLADACAAFGAKVSGVALTRVKDGVFFASVSLSMKNELGEKFVELDARPSDALTLALGSGAPVLVAKTLLDACEDAAPILEKLRSRDPGIVADSDFSKK